MSTFHRIGAAGRSAAAWPTARLAWSLALVPVAAAPAAAGTGTLSQLPGTAACVSDGGSGGNCVDGEALQGAQGVAVTRNGLSVYAASGQADGIAIFRRTGSGELLQEPGTLGCVTEDGSGGVCANGKALGGARDVALDKKGKHLYVAAPGSDAVAIFAREKTGELLQLGGTDGCVSLDGTGGECAIGTAMGGARAVTVGPKGKFVYVAARNDDAVVAFARDKKTGVLTQLAGTDGCVSDSGSAGQCANGVALDFPTDVAVSRKGDSLYVAAVGSNAIAIFDRDKKTGVLTQLTGTAGCISEDGSGGSCTDGRGLAGVFSLAISNDGKFVYAASRDGNAVASFARDRSTGELTQLAGTDGCISEDGSGGECADGAHLSGAVSVALSRDGRSAYVAAMESNALVVFARDKRTGVLTPLAGTDGCVSEDGSGGACADGVALVEPSSVVATRNGRSVYVASTTSDAVAAFERD